MLIKYLTICVCLSFALPAETEPADSSLATFVQSARAVLTGQDNSSSDLQGIAWHLLLAADSNSTHPLYAQAVFLAQMLLDSLDECVSEAELCRRLVTNSPESPFTMRSFEMVWNRLTEHGAAPVSGSEFALDMAVAARGELSDNLFDRGFQPYVDAGMWNLASEAGLRYLHSAETIHDPSIYIDVAGALLKTGDSDRSMELLRELVSSYPKHPAVIRGRTELGLIQLALGSIEEANNQFTQAWSTFQKLHKKLGYGTYDVLHSAARALWENQEYELSVLKRKFADRINTSDKAVRSDQKHLEAGYNLVMETDSSFTAQSWIRIGDLHLAFAEAYLREGYESIQTAEDGDLRNPYDRSLEYYQRAQVAYHNAMIDAKSDVETHPRHWSESNVDWNRMAIHNRYDVFDREADAIYEWAMDIWKHAPERDLGEDGLSRRYDLLAKRVIPLVIESLQYQQNAFDAASEYPSEFPLAGNLDALEREMWTSLNLVTSLCQLQWDATSATAIQLSKTLQITGNPAAVRTFRETLANQLDYSKMYWEEGQMAITDLYQAYLACHPRQESRDDWDRELMLFHQHFASLAGSSSSQLESSTTNLDPLDPVAQTLKQRLRSIASDAAKAEQQALTTAVDMASRFGINNEAFTDIYSRLREIDPAQYPTLEVYRASRR